ncbi:lasso RiPP family leader peptide-containing protein [uncultured Reyranella sp.]|jgi:hypothetical protein|uniref:lasso RiPP family leader peptide-containing protein n=1 Tax=uncultured Reyranella sp. TaxID=735512 RepID=UPI00259C9B34|nr:lasso RiPP family leader peptide-containing protein [uncultured Reyranella sp.]
MDDKSNDETETHASAPVAKKPYVKPVLVRLGELQDVTRTVGQRGARDGGGARRPRTAL